MFWNKQIRKGYVLIYTIIILSLLIGISILSFKIELMRKKYNDISVSTQILKNDFERERAYLLSKASKSIKENLGDKVLNEDEVHNILLQLKKIEFNSSFLQYRKSDKKIILNIFNERGEKKVEYYSYIISQPNKIVFITTTPW